MIWFFALFGLPAFLFACIALWRIAELQGEIIELKELRDRVGEGWVTSADQKLSHSMRIWRLEEKTGILRSQREKNPK